MRFRLLILSLLLVVLASPGAAHGAKIRYEFKDWQGPGLRVYASRPAALAPGRPVVIVMHGTRRNADEYRDQWHDLAIEHDFLLLVPEFKQRDFPGSDGYNLGYVADESGQPRARGLWSYSAIEPLFQDAIRRYGMVTTGYSLYGHSAGAQFVHRFLLHVPDAHVVRAVAANAGWYTMPDLQVEWPYGLRGSRVDSDALASALNTPLTVLLGDLDTDPDHESLRRTPQALAQGPHRMARGQAFFESARLHAGQLGLPFRWRLAYVPGVGHSNTEMAPAAIPFLLDLPRSAAETGGVDTAAQPGEGNGAQQQVGQ